MDENIIISAHHEAGHALIAHIVGWSIDSIILNIENGLLKCGVTKYDYKGDEINNLTNLRRRLLCLLGGPISQAFYENSTHLAFDSMGEDGKSIEKLLDSFNLTQRTKLIEDSITITSNLLRFVENKNAIAAIKNYLITNHSINQAEYINILNKFNIKIMDFTT
jgi:hypothetical protein